MEQVIAYNCNRFGVTYIDRGGLEWLTELSLHLRDDDMKFIDDAVQAAAVTRSFVEDATFEGRPVITKVDVERVLEFYKELRYVK
jgi:hypothetical protein